MARGDPELAGEFRGLVSEILLAKGGSADGLSEFDGGSSFMLWGALFINPSRPKTVVEMVETLAHESAHSLLFGLSIDDPLVENPDGERFKSPLRDDPRPMDGIYHATFVSARMHYAMARLADSGILTADQQAAAREAMESDRRAFRDGLATVEAHGRLTARGMAIMAGARDYMAA
jgi:HEXXH motif-containing protein